MKKSLCILSAALIVASSCSKYEQPVETNEVKMVNATINAQSAEGGSKTSATKEGDVYKIKWTAGDALSVFNSLDTDMSKFTTKNTGASAKFEGEIPEGSEIVAAIYPYYEKATISADKETVYTNVPTEQTGAFNNVVLAGWPKSEEDEMTIAETYDFKYQFEAVCGIVKFSFDPERIKDDKTITSISLTADQPLCGDAKISYEGEKPVLTPNPNAAASNVYNTVTIEKPTGFTAGDYYFATFPINAKEDEGLNIVIRFETSIGDVAYKQATLKAVAGEDGSKHILAANIVKNIGNVKVENYDQITGQFTVNGQWDSKQSKTIYKKVIFAPGNLQYQASGNNGNGLWRFALNQWDAQDQLGNATAPADLSGDEGERATQSEWIDLFPWGHTGFTHSSSVKMLPYRSSGNQLINYFAAYKTEGTLIGSDGDWGYYCDIVNGNKVDPKGTWRLMSQLEWNYLLNLNQTDPGVGNNGRYTQVKKLGGDGKNRYMYFTKMGLRTGVYDEDGNEIVRYGTLIFPDGFEWPAEIPIPKEDGWPYTTISHKGCTNAQAPKYTLAEFAIFEKLGCAFLPAAGRRNIATDQDGKPVVTVEQINENGVYWSGNACKDQAHFATYTANIALETTTGGNGQSRSVRLVKNGEGW